MLLQWSTVIASVGGVLLALLVLLRAKRNIGNTFFSLMSISLSLVVATNYFSLTSKDSSEMTLFWIRAVMFLVPFLMVFLFYFSRSYLSQNYKFNLKEFIAVLALTVGMSVINILPITYSGVKIDQAGVIVPETGFGLILNGFFILPLFGISILSMSRNSKNAINSNDRKRIQFALYSFLVTFGIQIITSFVVVSLFNYTNLVPVGSFLIFFFVIVITISIFRLKTFNLNMIGSVVFVVILAVLIFAEIFTTKDWQELVYKIILFLAVSFIGYEFIKSILDEYRLRKKVEHLAKELEQANVHLKELDAEKDNFISMASHELNSPLAAINGYLSMIVDDKIGGKLSPQHQQFIDNIYTSSKRLAHLVKDLLNVSRIEQHRIHLIYAETDMNKIIEQAVAEAKPNIEAQKHQITLDLDDDLPKTFGDVDRITEVVINLLGNAIKYTPPKGKIKIISKKEGDFLKVSVADNGIGISKEGKAKIFGKFEQGNISRDERKGTGLGLYIVKNLIELHKGKIWLESREDRGSTFFFTLPILAKLPPDKHAGEGGVLRLNK